MPFSRIKAERGARMARSPFADGRAVWPSALSKQDQKPMVTLAPCIITGGFPCYNYPPFKLATFDLKFANRPERIVNYYEYSEYSLPDSLA